ncbi:arginine--tRNA ligase [Blastococcus brunescens]|uniref:Arginine--tRNA ligase n=1 Tax=Blastococcus brunescens TaxID=1564165 RepID=A0ABZ1AYJ6_9ACTN|nr:arginine--tRNA ligase [Blastococcus sp. BMG 8361]WRL62718.1 arginine--tRNA ligase [Blastococcus sp. BMG 8361]
MTPEQLRDVVRTVVAAAVDRGALAVEVPAEVVVERPKNRAHGDYATNIALRLAKAAGRPPREVAELLAGDLAAEPGIATVDVAGPGFLNITLAQGALGQIAVQAVSAGPAYGRTQVLAGQKLNLEFVSSNPTGPVHIGGTRWAAVGDALGRLLEASGADVTREFYLNDAGAQIDRFAKSLQAAALGRPVPEDGYAGSYIGEIADKVVARVPGLLDRPADEQLPEFRAHGVELMVAEVRSSLVALGVEFDVFFSESSLHESGALEKAVARLREQGRSSSVTGPSGCGRRTSATTRTGSSSGPTASRPTSPPTAPITWTSGRGASTAS